MRLTVILIQVLLLLVFNSDRLFSQETGMTQNRVNSISQNTTSSLEAFGDTLWVGPGLNRWIEQGGDWLIPENADSVFDGRGRVFSLSLAQNSVFAGLGYTSVRDENNIQTAQGYYYSDTGGEEWAFLPFPLDPDADPGVCDPNVQDYQPGCDIEFTYGGQTYNRIRITVPQQSPPFEVDFRDNTLMSVNWASGLLRSTDGGVSWDRIILPPSNETELVPERSYSWLSQSRTGETIERYDPRFDNNLLAFGLLIDSQERVWVGTAAGINISDNALTAPSDSISWRRVPFLDRSDGLIGGWIIKIREQPETGRIWMTNWPSDTENRDRNGLVYTDDGGQTFVQQLIGEKINDIGFFDGSIFAVGDNGLFISNDDGKSWRKISQIRSPNTFLREDAQYLSTAATNSRIWIGTNDGLASSSDRGETWQITRVDFPLRGGSAYQPDAPDVDTYAYPNPYSPSRHNIVRIKYEVTSASNVKLRLFDFGMNLIDTLVDERMEPGTYETTWNGEDSRGRRVANGPVFYVIEQGNRQVDGKILILD